MNLTELSLKIKEILKDNIKPNNGTIKQIRASSISSEFIEYFKNFSTINNNDINIEKIYLCYHELNEIPKAECGNEAKFDTFNTGYSEWCKLPKFNKYDKDKNLIEEKCQYCHNKLQAKKDKTNIKLATQKAAQTHARNLGLENPDQYINMSMIPSIKEKRKQSKFAIDKSFQQDMRQKLHNKYGSEEKYKEAMAESTRTMMASMTDEQKDLWKAKISETHRKIKFNDIVSKVPNLEALIDYTEFNGVGYANKYPFRCKECGLEFDDSYVSTKLPQCPACKSKETKSKSKEEDSLYNFILTLTNEPVIRNDKSVLGKLELDIFIPSLNLAIEYNGVYWHCDKFVENDKQKLKLLKCRDKGIKLINVYSDDWLYKTEQVKHRLESLFGKSKTVYARKCTIKEVQVKESSEFLDKYHLRGSCGSTFKYGLYLKDELLAVMTFGINRFGDKKENTYELIRYASKVNVVGGCGKLFQYFIRTHNPDEVVSFADLEYGYGDVYPKIGFTFDKLTDPAYSYVHANKGIRESRMKYQKHKLIQEGFNPKLTESEIMSSRGFYKIYDCGNARYIWKKN